MNEHNNGQFEPLLNDAASLAEGQMEKANDASKPKRHVTPDMCRLILKRSDLSDTEAEEIIEHLYQFGDVVTDVLIEQGSDLPHGDVTSSLARSMNDECWTLRASQ